MRATPSRIQSMYFCGVRYAPDTYENRTGELGAFHS